MQQDTECSVLVVDDEALVCSLTAENLLELGFNVEIANSGVRALQMLADGLKVDILLTDVRMPNMNGFELSRRAVAIRPEIKVVYMTGYTLPNEPPHLALADAPVVAKPFTSKKLKQILYGVLEGRPVLSQS